MATVQTSTSQQSPRRSTAKSPRKTVTNTEKRLIVATDKIDLLTSNMAKFEKSIETRIDNLAGTVDRIDKRTVGINTRLGEIEKLLQEKL